MQVAPLRLTPRIVEIPAIVEFHALVLSCNESPDVGKHGIKVIRMNMLFIIIERKSFVRQHVTAQFTQILAMDIIDDHVVVTNFQRTLHQVMDVQCLVNPLTHSADNKTVDHQDNDNGCNHHHHDNCWDKLEQQAICKRQQQHHNSFFLLTRRFTIWASQGTDNHTVVPFPSSDSISIVPPICWISD